MKNVKDLTYKEAEKAAKKFVWRATRHAILVIIGIIADWYFCLTTVPSLSENAADGCLVSMGILTIFMIILGSMWIRMDWNEIKRETFQIQRNIIDTYKRNGRG